ncbi:hypothetical protein D5018_02490 [Parashewanella curva]|uniref:Uncharacterized protein n=1 Tax=Parashewanella curva TaxID=2338552 RepID=A0A3L8Q309_9GAMM|nr:hypothetical protein [Parashewanella curva]RLV61363.1 hypothetical protein D5018_02490 [Parashewanella curva]
MRYGWLAFSALFISTSSFAGIETQLKRCQIINDKLERLICYDRVAKSVNSTSTTSLSKAKVQSASKNLIPANPEDDFGRVKPKPDAIAKLNLTVASVTKSHYGTLRIRFSNGQSWRQLDSRRFRLKRGDKVFIKKAALGSFLLGMDGRNSTIRVKRDK